MRFTKMEGLGNDYVYVDCFAEKMPADPASVAQKIADRHFGVGGDGLILICPSERGDARMRMFNADGSESEMCGNGVRCVAKYVYDHGIAKKDTLQIETGNGVLSLALETTGGKVRRVRVDMGEPIFDALRIPTTFTTTPVVNAALKIHDRDFAVTCVSMGSPNCVIYVEEATDELVLGYVPKIEQDAHFPHCLNVE